MRQTSPSGEVGPQVRVGSPAKYADALSPSAHVIEDPTPGLRPDPRLKEEGDAAPYRKKHS
ncbi:hypothetical protein CK216_26470 [Mesorhizobium sp. WSM3876]|nr:hypothetical protein CK216_26470 [Mesorhizobium sp. WSM3876]